MKERRIGFRLALLIAVLTVPIHAQSVVSNNVPADGLEIRGTVVEPSYSGGSGVLGVGGAQIKLTEFRTIDNTLTPAVFATTLTDSQGNFRFHPARLGEYMVEVKMEGYLPVGVQARVEITGTTRYATLSREKPTAEIGFSLTRRAELTGRVLDEDGNPVPELPVRIYGRGAMRTADNAVTNGDGSFRAASLQPGRYAVGTLPKVGGPAVMTLFSEKDVDVVDTDFEITYWPGVPDIDSATPWTASPGASMNLPDLHLRKVSTYRAHISVKANACAEAEQWSLLILKVQPDALRALSPLDSAPIKVACGKELLVRNLRPGGYWFALWSGKRESVDTWALQQVEIKDQNIQVAMAMSRGADLNGRLVPAEGAKLPPGNAIVLNVMSMVVGLPTGANTRIVDGSGIFGLNNLPWGSVRIQPLFLGNRIDYYVQAIRMNGQVIPDGVVNLAGGAGAIEIVVDDKPAMVVASVFDGEKPYAQGSVVMVKMPLAPGISVSDLQQSRRVIMNGVDNVVGAAQIQVQGLAPGEYRAFAVRREDREKVLESTVLERLASRGEKIVLERGGSQNITLKLVDPSR